MITTTNTSTTSTNATNKETLATQSQILQEIYQAKNILYIIDSRPDFDAFGSTLALKYFTDTLNIPSTVIYDGVIPESIKKELAMLVPDLLAKIRESTCPAEFIKTAPTNSLETPKPFDLAILCDSGDLQHACSHSLKTDFSAQNIKTILIDHHPKAQPFTDINLYQELSSTCSMVYQLLELANQQVTSRPCYPEAIASILYLGMLTDSGFFQYKGLTSTDLRIAAGLLDKGARAYDMVWRLTFNQSLQSFKLTKIILTNLQVNYAKKCAYSVILLKDLEKEGISYSDAKSFSESDTIKRLEGVDFVFVIKERLLDEVERATGKKAWAISFRSHQPNFNVRELAEQLNGGGHNMAAGAHIEADSLEKAIKKVLELV